jgi:hypothetical protein
MFELMKENLLLLLLFTKVVLVFEVSFSVLTVFFMRLYL